MQTTEENLQINGLNTFQGHVNRLLKTSRKFNFSVMTLLQHSTEIYIQKILISLSQWNKLCREETLRQTQARTLLEESSSKCVCQIFRMSKKNAELLLVTRHYGLNKSLLHSKTRSNLWKMRERGRSASSFDVPLLSFCKQQKNYTRGRKITLMQLNKLHPKRKYWILFKEQNFWRSSDKC